MNRETFLTQHASPRWVSSKIYIDSIPEKQRDKTIEKLAFTFPTWFFEVLCKFDDKPLVLEDFQIKYLLDDSRLKITSKTRQSGGSLQLAFAKFFRAYTTPNYRCDIVSINRSEATDKIKYIRNLWDSMPARYQIPLVKDNALSIAFHQGSRQSTVQSIAASSGVRGGRKDVVFDEFAHIAKAKDLFYAAAPAIINGQLKLDIVSTPLGNLNMFAKIFQNQEDERGFKPFDQFSRHEFLWFDVSRFVTDRVAAREAWTQKYHCDTSMMEKLVFEYGTDDIKMYYHMYPFDYFTQEFCGAFLNEIGAFFPWDLILSCTKTTDPKIEEEGQVFADSKEVMVKWYARPKDNGNTVFIGIDFGESEKETDKTSIQILEKGEDGAFYHRYSEVLRKADYPDFPAQAEHMAELVHKFKPEKILCDDTGLGRGIVPLLKRLVPEYTVEPVNFNLKSKETMVMNLKTLMEKKKIWLQREDTLLLGQIRNIQRDLSPSGAHRYFGKDGTTDEKRDDMFWALALAAYGEGEQTEFVMYSIGGSRGRWGLG